MKIRLPILALTFLLLMAPADVAWSQESYRILITNDDGIQSPGVTALVEALGGVAEVVVVAPAENRSGSSHATEALRGLTRVTPFLRDGKLFGYAVSGTPADAARFGIVELGAEQPFDLVISGINQGENVGLLSHLSGTVGAAMEALFHGVPSIAVSQSRRRGDDYETAARFVAQLLAQVRDRGLPPGVLLSINVPGGEIKGAIAARMAGLLFDFQGFESQGQEDATQLYRPRIGFVRPSEGGDTRAFLAGYITVTPLRLDWTDYAMLGELGDWDLAPAAVARCAAAPSVQNR